FCTPGILELLASGGVLDAAARTYRLGVDRRDYELFVANELAAYATGDVDANWMTALIDRIGRGIDTGTYLVMPDLDQAAPAVAVNDDSPDSKCFLDLLRFPPEANDAIWIDDRFMTGYIHRDGVPIVDTLDLLEILRDRNHINENQLLEITHRLREGDFHFIGLTQREIERRASETVIREDRLVESRELRTLRRH